MIDFSFLLADRENLYKSTDKENQTGQAASLRLMQTSDSECRSLRELSNHLKDNLHLWMLLRTWFCNESDEPRDFN